MDFNKKSDAWVSEICKCSADTGLSVGQAIDHLMAKRKDEPMNILPSSEVVEVQPQYSSGQRVSCPKCHVGMTYEHYLKHWVDSHS
jgi:fructoselysine-6-P-deglycase FrlB-like protein